MHAEGPQLETLTRRLAECPAEFLDEPMIGTKGAVNVAAVVSDLLHDLGGELLSRQSAGPFVGATDKDRNRLRVALIAAWLLHDSWFRQHRTLAGVARDFLAGGLADLATVVDAPQLVQDADRREELARVCLHALGLRPAGESVAQAQDRLTTLSSVERQRVILETRKAQERAAAIREAMRKKAAEEAAAKYARE